MNKGEFNIRKARTNLLVLDYIALSIASMSLSLSLFVSCIVRVPDALTILKLVFIASLIIIIKSVNNIRKFYFKKDELYTFI